MEKTVLFRDFEERDIDFIYKCKNDKELNSLIVNQKPSFSYEEATNWVLGCMGNHDTFKFWAICTNDESKRIVGWVSISQIDYINKNALFHGIVIADKDYKDGITWIETYLFIFDYVFNVISLHRLYGAHIANHPMSEPMAEAMFLKREGLKKDAIFRNNIYMDVAIDAILDNEYFYHLNNGEYEVKAIIKRLIKEKRKQI